MKRKLLICGATGFVGRNLAEFFSARDEYEVYGTYFHRQPFATDGITFIKADLTQEAQVNQVVQGMDIIVQAAASTSGSKEILSKPYYHVTDNAIMNSHIFRASYEFDVSQLLFFSCSIMYQSSVEPLAEEQLDPSREMHRSYFGAGWTKLYLEKMCEFYSRLGRTKFTVVRHSNNYGPYDKFDLERSHVFGATLTKVMLAEEGGGIAVWGNGDEGRDLLYISDLVHFVKLALHHQEAPYELYNVGCGKVIAIKDLVQKIVEISGKKIEIEFDLSKPTIATSLSLDSSKAKKDLGWSPEVSIEEGIKKTISWYRKNLL